MANSLKHNAFSLVELLVVLGIIAALAAIAIPSIKAMQKSYDSTGAESMISTALSTARTIAISKGRYAGVRFQKEGDPNSPLDKNQYMIFVINDEDITTMADGYRAIEGYKPIRLPENTGVVSNFVRTDYRDSEAGSRSANANEQYIKLGDFTNNFERTLTDISAFSIVFSPSGKLVIHDIRIRNNNGEWRPPDTVVTGAGHNGSKDMVFNSFKNLMDNNTGQFVQDDYAQNGLGGEKSRNKLYLYDKDKFNKMSDSQRWNYLDGIKPCTLNPYTGAIVRN